MALFIAESLTNFFQLVGAIFGLFPDIPADKNGSFGLGRENETVAGTSIDLNDLRVDFIVGLEDDPGEIGIAPEIVDHHPLHLDVESSKNKADQLMGEWAFIVLAAHRHGDGPSDGWLDVDDETLFIVANENGQGVLFRGKNPENFHTYHFRIHNSPVPLPGSNDNAGTVYVTFLIVRKNFFSVSLRGLESQELALMRCRKR